MYHKVETARPGDVLVVGAGLCGLACARELARRGVATTLVDRKERVGDAVQTTGIFVRRSLEQFALPAAHLGPPIRHVALLSPRRRAVLLESPRDEFRVGRMRPLYESLLDDCVAAGVRWLPGTRYLGSERAGGGSRVFLSRRGALRSAIVSLVVGTDGAASRVARDLRLSLNRRWIVGAEQVLAGVPLHGPPRFLCFVDPDLAPGYIAWMVHDGEEAHVGVGGYPARFDPARALRRFRAEIARHFDLADARVVERRGGRIPVGGLLRRITSPRGILAGDAAGAPSPLTAGGFDAALRMARRAGEAVERHLAGEEDALPEYPGDALERPLGWPRAMRAILGAVRSPALIELACRFLPIPPLRGLAARIYFGNAKPWP